MTASSRMARAGMDKRLTAFTMAALAVMTD
jgi:hypothetical protein